MYGGDDDDDDDNDDDCDVELDGDIYKVPAPAHFQMLLSFLYSSLLPWCGSGPLMSVPCSTRHQT